MTIKAGLPLLSLLLKASTTQLLYKLFDASSIYWVPRTVLIDQWQIISFTPKRLGVQNPLGTLTTALLVIEVQLPIRLPWRALAFSWEQVYYWCLTRTSHKENGSDGSFQTESHPMDKFGCKTILQIVRTLIFVVGIGDVDNVSE